MLWVCRIKQCQHFDFAEMKIQRLEATYKLILIQIAIFVHVIRSDLFCFDHVRMNIVLEDFFLSWVYRKRDVTRFEKSSVLIPLSNASGDKSVSSINSARWRSAFGSIIISIALATTWTTW